MSRNTRVSEREVKGESARQPFCAHSIAALGSL